MDTFRSLFCTRRNLQVKTITSSQLIARLNIFLLVLFSVYSAECNAHDFWLAAHGKTSPGNTVSISARAGSEWPGKQVVRSEGMVEYFKLFYGNGSQWDDINGHDNSFVFGHYKVKENATQMALLKTNNYELNLPAEEFNQYLEEEDLQEAIDYRKNNNLTETESFELFSRIAKIYPRVVDDSSLNKTYNLPFEITLANISSEENTKSHIQVMLSKANKPVINKRIKAFCQGSEKLYYSKTNDKGLATFEIDKQGVWTFSSVELIHLYHGSYQWQSIWTSLTLTLPVHNK